MLIYTDEAGRAVVSVDYLGLETTVCQSQEDNKAIVQLDNKPGMVHNESTLRVYASDQVLYGNPLYDIHDISIGEGHTALFSHPAMKEQ